MHTYSKSISEKGILHHIVGCKLDLKNNQIFQKYYLWTDISLFNIYNNLYQIMFSHAFWGYMNDV